MARSTDEFAVAQFQQVAIVGGMRVVACAAVSLTEGLVNVPVIHVSPDLLVALETEFGTLPIQHEFLLEAVTGVAGITGPLFDGIMDILPGVEFFPGILVAVVTRFPLRQKWRNQKEVQQQYQKNHIFITLH